MTRELSTNQLTLDVVLHFSTAELKYSETTKHLKQAKNVLLGGTTPFFPKFAFFL